MANLIQLTGRDTNTYVFPYHPQNLACQVTSNPHGFDFFGCF
jgi:hypothetical protein